MEERPNYEDALQNAEMEKLKLQSQLFSLDAIREHEERERNRQGSVTFGIHPLDVPETQIQEHPLNLESAPLAGIGDQAFSDGISLQPDSLSVTSLNLSPTQPSPLPPPRSALSRLKKGSIVKTLFSQFTLNNQIDQGGNARVFSAVDEKGNPVAIKFLENNVHIKRFENEIRFCEQKRHPNIIHVLDRGLVELKDGDCPFCVMPLYEKSLRKRLEEGLFPKQAICIFVGLLAGMAEAHSKGIVHRDLKPENILFLKDSDEPVIADFGIAHFPAELMATTVDTLESDRLANRYYAAPEQMPGNPVGPPADMFALGLMLNEMFTGKIPKAMGFTTIRDVNPKYGYLDTMFESLFQQDPAKRLPSAKAGLNELERLAIEVKDEETVRCIRNHGEENGQLGPFNHSTDKKEAVMITAKTAEYCSPRNKGSFTFDYSNNNGEFVIGEGDKTFRTRWSKASDRSIYALNDGLGIEKIARLKNVGEIESIRKIEGDFSSRHRQPEIGDAIVWKNNKGYYAITKIVSIKDDTRGSAHDELTCDYVVLEQVLSN